MLNNNNNNLKLLIEYHTCTLQFYRYYIRVILHVSLFSIRNSLHTPNFNLIKYNGISHYMYKVYSAGVEKIFK